MPVNLSPCYYFLSKSERLKFKNGKRIKKRTHFHIKTKAFICLDMYAYMCIKIAHSSSLNFWTMA